MFGANPHNLLFVYKNPKEKTANNKSKIPISARKSNLYKYIGEWKKFRI